MTRVQADPSGALLASAEGVARGSGCAPRGGAGRLAAVRLQGPQSDRTFTPRAGVDHPARICARAGGPGGPASSFTRSSTPPGATSTGPARAIPAGCAWRRGCAPCWPGVHGSPPRHRRGATSPTWTCCPRGSATCSPAWASSWSARATWCRPSTRCGPRCSARNMAAPRRWSRPSPGTPSPGPRAICPSATPSPRAPWPPGSARNWCGAAPRSTPTASSRSVPRRPIPTTIRARWAAPSAPADLLLIDLWGALHEDSVPADQTWMGFMGSALPPRLAEMWQVLKAARDGVVESLRTRFERGEVLRRLRGRRRGP